MPALLVIGALAVLVAAYFVARRHDAFADRRIVEFLATYGLTYKSYNGAGCYANSVEKFVRKNPGCDLSQMALAVNEFSFQMGLYGGYPRDENDWPTFLGLPILLDLSLETILPSNGTVIARNSDLAALCYESMAVYRNREQARAAADLAKSQAEEDHAVELLARALREVATDDTDLGRVLAEALAN
jgi:type II secretory pathway pseudopilin PulG